MLLQVLFTLAIWSPLEFRVKPFLNWVAEFRCIPIGLQKRSELYSKYLSRCNKELCSHLEFPAKSAFEWRWIADRVRSPSTYAQRSNDPVGNKLPAQQETNMTRWSVFGLYSVKQAVSGQMWSIVLKWCWLYSKIETKAEWLIVCWVLLVLSWLLRGREIMRPVLRSKHSLGRSQTKLEYSMILWLA